MVLETPLEIIRHGERVVQFFGGFAQALRERVQWSVAHAAPVALPGGRTARVAVRRRASGEMFSQVVGEAGLDLSDPEIARVVDAAESRARAAVGLPM
jgi:hypothetical protein